jgi:HEAT repeat protein
MRRLLLLVLVLVPVPCVRGEADPKTKDIEKLIVQLGDQEFSVREKASRSLEKIGVPALEQLRLAEKSEDPEVVRRAKLAIDFIEENDPKLSQLRKEKRINLLIEQLAGPGRSPAMRELQMIGKDALPALDKAAKTSTNAIIKSLATSLANSIRRTNP